MAELKTQRQIENDLRVLERTYRILGEYDIHTGREPIREAAGVLAQHLKNAADCEPHVTIVGNDWSTDE